MLVAGTALVTTSRAAAADHLSEKPLPIDLETATVAQLDGLQDTAGPLTRTVADAAAVPTAIDGRGQEAGRRR